MMRSFSEKAFLRLVYTALIAASILCILGKFGYVNESHSIGKNTILSSTGTGGLQEKISLLRGRKLQYSRIENSLLDNHEMKERSSNQIDIINSDREYRDLKSAFLQKIASFTATTDMEEQIGTAVDISDDGTVIAISGIEQTYFNSELFRYIVKVWKETTDGKWVQVGQDIKGKNTTEWRDDARADISISGDGKRLAIGNVYLPDRGLDDRNAEGTVEIFEHDLSLNPSRDWLHIATPYSGSAGGGGAHLGLKVSLDSTGSSLVIGERYHDTSSSNDHGRILVYSVASTFNGSADISPKGDSPIIGQTSRGHSGSSVMISGDGNCFIFGSIGDEDTDRSESAAKTGSASVYCLESNIWKLRGDKVIHGDSTGDEFGSSVAINSDATFIAIGAVKYDDAKNGKNVGVVRTFRWNGTSYNEFGGPIIGEQGEMTSRIDGYYAGEYSGYSVDITDVTDNGMIRVVIGSPNSGGQYYHGRARLFEVDTDSDSPEWKLVVSDVGGNESSLGRSVAMSSTGKRIIVGGPTHNNENDSYYEGIVDVIEQMEYTGTPSKFPSLRPSQSLTPTNSASPSVLPSISPSQSPSIEPLPVLQENDITSSPSVQSSQASSESNSTLASTACPTDLDNVSHFLTFLRKIICFFQK